MTGITQATVDAGVSFEECFRAFNAILLAKGLLDPSIKWTFVTCGNWDLQTMLPAQLQLSGLRTRKYFRRWIDIKIPFRKHFYGNKRGPLGVTGMLNRLGLKFQGRQHSGIDDCRNTATILIKLIEAGVELQPTGFI